MKKGSGKRVARVLLLSSLAVSSACDGRAPVEAPLAPQPDISSHDSLIQCPSDQTLRGSGSVSPLGGRVNLAGHAVVVSLGAVLGGADIAIEVPASPHMRVDLTANGQEHWQFLAPLTVTIDYSRCPASALGGGPLSVWHIDPETGELLQNMGGIDNRALRRITFFTDHFSGYAIAN